MLTLIPVLPKRVISTRIVPNDSLDLVLEELTRIWTAQLGAGSTTRLYYTDNVGKDRRIITEAWEKVFNMKASDINPSDGLPNFVVLQGAYFPCPVCCINPARGGASNAPPPLPLPSYPRLLARKESRGAYIE